MMELTPVDETADRLGLALFLAALVHVALLLGIGFEAFGTGDRARSLDVTLARFKQDETVEDADFLAQFNQQGSGEAETHSELTAPVLSESNASSVNRPMTPSGSPAETRRSDQPLVVTENRSELRQVEAVPSPQDSSRLGVASPDPVQAERVESLIARLDQQIREYAKRPKVRQLTAVSARQADEAAYLYSWQTRIETIGNENYPLEARRNRLFGDLRLLVAVDADGWVREMRVLESSGSRVLDDAAQRIVRLAEPFDPMPESMRRETDVVEIIRTWQFRQDRVTATR